MYPAITFAPTILMTKTPSIGVSPDALASTLWKPWIEQGLLSNLARL